MKKGKTFILVLLIALITANTQASHSINIKPVINWDCYIVRLSDDIGDFVYFDPRAEVTWLGKKLTFNAYYWASRDSRKSKAAQRYGTVKNNSVQYSVSKIDLSHKFYYEAADSKYKKITLVVKDSSGRTATQSCIWKGPVARG